MTVTVKKNPREPVRDRIEMKKFRMTLSRLKAKRCWIIPKKHAKNHGRTIQDTPENHMKNHGRSPGNHGHNLAIVRPRSKARGDNELVPGWTLAVNL